MTIDSSI